MEAQMKRNSWKIVLFVFLVAGAAAAASPWFLDPLRWFGKPSGWGAGENASYALWRDDAGWHLRATTKIRSRTFSGVIKIKGGDLTSVKPTGLEKQDRMILTPGRDTINFSFKVRRGVDGFDWRWNGDIARFNLYLDGKRIDPSKVFIGRRGVHPASNPFSFRRGREGIVIQPPPSPPDPDRILSNPKTWNGKPAGWDSGDPASVAMWHDEFGWHLRTTTKVLQRRFKGHIRTAGGRVTNIRPVDPERGDRITLTGDDSIINFDFGVRRGVDGFDWTWSGDRLQVLLEIDGKLLHPSDICIGRFSLHPGSNPFTLER